MTAAGSPRGWTTTPARPPRPAPPRPSCLTPPWPAERQPRSVADRSATVAGQNHQNDVMSAHYARREAGSAGSRRGSAATRERRAIRSRRAPPPTARQAWKEKTMAYGHAERNLALIRQLEAETRQLLDSLSQLDQEQQAWLEEASSSGK